MRTPSWSLRRPASSRSASAASGRPSASWTWPRASRKAGSQGLPVEALGAPVLHLPPSGVDLAPGELGFGQQGVRGGQGERPAVASARERVLEVRHGVVHAAAAQDGEATEVRGGGKRDDGAAPLRVVERHCERELGALQVLREGERSDGQVERKCVRPLLLEQPPAVERLLGELHGRSRIPAPGQRTLEGHVRHQLPADGRLRSVGGELEQRLELRERTGGLV